MPYFTVPGYKDPVDRAAGLVLTVSLALFVLMGLWEIGAYSWRNRPSSSAPVLAAPKSLKPKPHPQDRDVKRAVRGTEAAEDFLNCTEENARSDIDKADSHNDKP